VQVALRPDYRKKGRKGTIIVYITIPPVPEQASESVFGMLYQARKGHDNVGLVQGSALAQHAG
jgi:hypothetical protein